MAAAIYIFLCTKTSPHKGRGHCSWIFSSVLPFTACDHKIFWYEKGVIFEIESTLIISTSFISNNPLFRSQKFVPVLTWKSSNRQQNIVEKRGNFSSFPQYFHYISLTSGVRLHIRLWDKVVRFIFSSILQIWNVVVRISRSISEGPLDFEITRVDCSIEDAQ